MKFRSIADEELAHFTRENGPYSSIVLPNRITSSISPAVWWELKSPVDSHQCIDMLSMRTLSKLKQRGEESQRFRVETNEDPQSLGYARTQGVNFTGYLNPVNPRDTEKT